MTSSLRLAGNGGHWPVGLLWLSTVLIAAGADGLQDLFLPKLILLVAVSVSVSCAAWRPYETTSGAILPAREVGDYGIEWPLGTPRPGDPVAFRADGAQDDFIFRLIAEEGQTFHIFAGRLYVDDAHVGWDVKPPFENAEMPREPLGLAQRCVSDPVGLGESCLKDRATEPLPNGAAYDVPDVQIQASLDNASRFLVRAGHVLVLRDSRDNFDDSGVSEQVGSFGFVSTEAIRGRWVGTIFNTSIFRP